MVYKVFFAVFLVFTIVILVESWGTVKKEGKHRDKQRDRIGTAGYSKKYKKTETSSQESTFDADRYSKNKKTQTSRQDSTSHRIVKLKPEEGQKFAKALNKKRSKLAKGLKKFHLRYASKMYKSEWNPTLASIAKELLKNHPPPVTFVVMLREIKDDLDIFLAALDAYFYELADNGIDCDNRKKKCVKKRVRTDTGLKLTLPYELAYSKATKIGCAVEYWKNEKSVKTAKLIGRKEKSYRARMVCQSSPAPNEIMYEVGRPCSACEEDTFCDKSTGMCMTDGFNKRHPSGFLDK